MFFWLITITRYFLVAVVACLLSLVISFFVMGLFLSNNENPVVGGVFSFFLFLPMGGLLVPLCLAITAELVERKVQSRDFSWSKVRGRFLVAIPMAIGPLYTALFVVMRVEDRRPAHWLETAVLLCCLSAVFAYFSLRIRKPRTQPETSDSETVSE